VPVPIVFYVSGHGFGHASRTIEVINALLARRSDARVHVRSSAPRWLFDLTVTGPFDFTEIEVDVGVVQIDALTPDLAATLARAAAFYTDSTAMIVREAAALAKCGARVVVADAPPVAFSAAAARGVPAVALCNFTWDWIYEDYAEALGVTTTVPALIRRWHGCAREAWRLPMHGGFDGFRHIRDLELIARRSRRGREQTREAFGWSDARPIVLVSFGGVGLRGLPLESMARDGELLLLTTSPVSDSRSGRGVSSRAVSDGIVIIDDRALYEEGWRYEDIVAAADVVVTKPGYGIIAECIANETSLLYTSRGRFAEYDVLVEAMPKWLRCRFIPQEDLLRGALATHVRALLAQPAAPERPAVSGADVAAEWLTELL
jgi:L-arabinokinase